MRLIILFFNKKASKKLIYKEKIYKGPNLEFYFVFHLFATISANINLG
jgi:hypothetical protein